MPCLCSRAVTWGARGGGMQADGQACGQAQAARLLIARRPLYGSACQPAAPPRGSAWALNCRAAAARARLCPVCGTPTAAV